MNSPLPFSSIARGTYSSVTVAEEALIGSSAEWQRLWARHAPGTPAPAVDFVAALVIAVFAGQRPTGGYGVQILDIESRGAETVVSYEVTAPAPGVMVSQVHTAPFHIVTLPRPTSRIRFERR
jgi:hypothetical protein